MVAVAENLTLAEFQARFGHGDRPYEFWYGRVIPKSMPTWLHGVLQYIVMQLLNEAGYIPGSEVELRIDPGARPRPDIIAAKHNVQASYPTKAVEVIVEILSPDDDAAYVNEKCRTYFAWGFTEIYVVNPQSRSLAWWTGELLEATNNLTTVAASEIWKRLDQTLNRTESAVLPPL